MFIHLYPGATGTSFALPDRPDRRGGLLGWRCLRWSSYLEVAVLTMCYRPLLFATVDPEVAAGAVFPYARWASVRGAGGVTARKACRSSVRCW